MNHENNQPLRIRQRDLWIAITRNCALGRGFGAARGLRLCEIQKSANEATDPIEAGKWSALEREVIKKLSHQE